MNKLSLALAALAVLVLPLIAMAGPKAPRAKDGKPFAVSVITERGITKDMDEARVKQMNQLGEWMENDLLKLLDKAGYEASIISKPQEFKPAAGRFLLKVSVKDYKAGSKAARMMVGFGAGHTSLDTRVELRGMGKKPLMAEDMSVGSSRDWRNCARKLNEDTVSAITARLSGL